MRLRYLAPAIVAVTVGAPSAFAQDAQAPTGFNPQSTIQNFLTDPEPLGATEATVGAVTSDGDTVTASDVTIGWTVEFGVGDQSARVVASVTAPSVAVSGLRPEGERFAADRIALPEVHLNISVEGAPDQLSYDLTMTDYVVEGFEWGELPAVQANPAAPVSRFAPLVHWAVDQSYEHAMVGKIVGNVVSDGQAQEISYGPVELGPVRDGKLDKFEYGPMTSTQTTEMPNASGELVPTTVTMSYQGSRGTGIDIKPLAALLTGIDASDGPQPILASVTLDGFSVEAGDQVTVTTGPTTMENITIDASRGPLMTRADDFVTAMLDNEQPEPATLVSFVLDTYGAIGIGSYNLSNLEATFQGNRFGLGEFVVEGLSAMGMDRFAVNEVSIDAAGTKASLGAFELADFVFPDRTAFLNVIMGSMAGMQPDFQTITSAIPYLGRATVRDVAVSTPGMTDLKMTLFQTSLADYISAIPTRIKLELQGLEMPLAMVPDPMTQMMFQSLNVDPITADGTIGLRWDNDSQRVELENDITVPGVGRLKADAAMAGIPRVIFEDPSRVQEALATAALVGLTARFEDQGLTNFLLNMVASQSGMTGEEFAAGITQQAGMQISMLTGDQELGNQISSALSTFFGDPQSITIAANPAAPVSVAQIMGAAMTAPQALPQLINFSLTANE